MMRPTENVLQNPSMKTLNYALLCVVCLLTASSCTTRPVQRDTRWEGRVQEIMARHDAEVLRREEVQARLPPARHAAVRIRSKENGYVLSYALDDTWRVSIGYDHSGEVRTNVHPRFAGGHPRDPFSGPLILERMAAEGNEAAAGE